MTLRHRIAVIADIHGNLPALEAVLADLSRQGVDEVLVGGDLVGRGPQGSAVVRRIQAAGFPSVRGNHEDYLLEFRRGQVPAEWKDDEAWNAWRWMAAELGEDDALYIDSLPLFLEPRATSGLRLYHGSPRGHGDGLGPWSSDEVLRGHLVAAGVPLLVCAHTHRPMVRRYPSGLVVNVGAVGLPFNGDRRAQYAVFEGADDDWEVELRQVPYDLAEIFAVYEDSGFRRAGGVCASLLALELEHAAPFLVPFLRWAEVVGVVADVGKLPEFLGLYDPGQPMEVFFRHLDGMAIRQSRGRRQPVVE